MKVLSSLAVLTIALTGCSGGGGAAGPVGLNSTGEPVASSSAFSCAPLGGGAATIEAGCVNCSTHTFSDIGNAIDTDVASAATLDTYNPGDSLSQATVLTITATAQKGIVFPALGYAGVAMQAPVGYSDYYVTVNALLDGVVQGSHFEVPVQHANGEFVYFAFDRIGKPFDALQLVINENNPSAEHHVYKLLEFCADGALK